MKFISNFPKHLYKENVPLSKYSSMRTGGIAKLVFYPTCENELLAVVSELKNQNMPIKIFGNMGNVLFPDQGIETPIIITQKMCCKYTVENNNETGFIPQDNQCYIYASCGTALTPFALSVCKNGYEGMEFAFGIPASVGGAIYMNAGAYGGEMGGVIKYVKCIDMQSLKFELLTNEQCDFSYRHSAFQNNGKIIIGGYFCVNKGNRDEIMSKAHEHMNSRKLKQPLEYPSCGSAFKRPEGHFAGKLIEDCGLKGYSINGACVSEKHAGFIVNKGTATSNDVLKLIEAVQKTVFEKFGVMLEPEIQIIHN